MRLPRSTSPSCFTEPLAGKTTNFSYLVRRLRQFAVAAISCRQIRSGELQPGRLPPPTFMCAHWSFNG